MPIKYISKSEIPYIVSGLSEDFVLIENPSYIFPKFEFVPLADKIKKIDELSAVVMDMDGTTTTTEVLCIHSLEYMIRQITGRMTKDIWHGLDEGRDYPHIIGNSTTKHVEYLIKTYRDSINIEELKRTFINSAVRTLCFGKDSGRIAEVKNNLSTFGIEKLQYDDLLNSIISKGVAKFDLSISLSKIIKSYIGQFKIETEQDVVRAGIDIYYARYHEILARISAGESEKIIKELELPMGKHLIEPMPGALLLLLLLKGKLKGKIEEMLGYLTTHFDLSITADNNLDSQLGLLHQMASQFENKPVKIAVVTSSISYEADVVLGEVFKVFRDQIKEFGFSNPDEMEELVSLLSDYHSFYDAVVTASDSSEIRLKPYRDLYSLALYRLGVPTQNFNEVIGFEDSESGNVAIRAAGIGVAVAVPFAQTAGHNLNVATYISKGGIPEVIFKKHLFLNHN